MKRRFFLCIAIGMLALLAWNAYAGTISKEDCEKQAEKARQRMPEGFALIVECPFVVIGDGTPEQVRRSAEGTVRWAAERLKRDFFTEDPDGVYEIWLFKDAESYKKHALELFGDKPASPYGYCSRAHKALIMNIATGGGTLVHEMVHAYMQANFPKCPAWFNEGMGSLFEQCHDKEGHIRGLTNWRLAGLQEAIRKKTIGDFLALVHTTDTEFYGEGSGLRYAQARYLCYYLQEKELLQRFYKEFHAAAKDDPSGWQTLQSVLGETDMAAFKKRWEEFVLGLKF